MNLKPWHLAVVMLFGLLTGFGFGRHLTPERVVSVENTAEVARLRQQVASLTQEITTLKRHTVKRTEVKFTPTGKPLSKVTITDTHVDKVTGSVSDVRASTDVHSAKLTERKTETTSKRPDWKISALVGFDLSARVPVYGGHVQRRILGSLSLGIWGTTSGGLPVLGGSVSIEF